VSSVSLSSSSVGFAFSASLFTKWRNVGVE
jgi:hypothetical protein